MPASKLLPRLSRCLVEHCEPWHRCFVRADAMRCVVRAVAFNAGPMIRFARHAQRIATRPSLVVTRREGRILVRCFAGCRVSAIVRALGLTMADLFDGPRTAAVQPQLVATYPYTGRQRRNHRGKAAIRAEGVSLASAGSDRAVWLAARIQWLAAGSYRWPELIDAGKSRAKWGAEV